MKCNEIRNLVLPYLDSELDARTSQEIQLHLDTCTECSQLFAREEKVNARLFAALGAGKLTPALWESAESRLQARQSVPGWFGRWRWVAAGALAALVLAGLLAVWIEPARRDVSLDLARAVEQDHREFLAGKMKPEFTGALPDRMIGQLEGRLDAAAFRTLPGPGRFRSEGARLCHLDGVPVAWTMGRCGNVPLSLIVFKASELGHFPETQHRLAAREPIVCARAGRFQFAVGIAGDHVVCAIAQTSKETLEGLLRSMAVPR